MKNTNKSSAKAASTVRRAKIGKLIEAINLSRMNLAAKKKTRTEELVDALPHDVRMRWLLAAMYERDPQYVTSLLTR